MTTLETEYKARRIIVFFPENQIALAITAWTNKFAPFSDCFPLKILDIEM